MLPGGFEAITADAERQQLKKKRPSLFFFSRPLIPGPETQRTPRRRAEPEAARPKVTLHPCGWFVISYE
jgi:hypothetical protein